ncbi:uncharacterized protein PHALS_15394 [Plasmopara halstedii]|uniref:Uncharacterized protein n=1 Tax=Plasmopara halstedii TaxID=4781 RepID=A0A0P1AEX1_PLAHL|nr:uncharacterized protein PHALS_15394 [Plasmopara halstedii]CEG39590.1 hypothetical protein PHALS_15394 [Plasmopara halstedii]|eukprot:XP_024575959.1 hypothetical protein PHALS_15394 [Plasmopara halstedii]
MKIRRCRYHIGPQPAKAEAWRYSRVGRPAVTPAVVACVVCTSQFTWQINRLLVELLSLFLFLTLLQFNVRRHVRLFLLAVE